MNTKHWYKPKAYIHFSPSFNRRDYDFVESYVSKEINIIKHGFFPLINKVVTEKRYKKLKNENEETIRSHYDYVNKKSTAKERQIYYANHLDSYIYAYYAREIVGKKYEEVINSNPSLHLSVCAYRFIETKPGSNRGKSNAHFAKEVFDYISSNPSCAVLCFDIEKFFDSLDHNYLKKMWCKAIGEKLLPLDQYKIYKFLTNFTYVEESDLLKEYNHHIIPRSILKQHRQDNNFVCYCPEKKDFKNKIIGRNNYKNKSLIKFHPFKDTQGKLKGIPQGTAISALLANIYMLDFDNKINAKLATLEGIYRRYSDDIIIVTSLENKNEILEFVNREIEINKLSFNDKTEIVEFIDGKPINSNLKYLGFEFNGNSALIKSSSLAKYYRKVKRHIKIKALKAYYLQKKKQTIHTQIYRKNLYIKYSHLGKRNYINYAYKSSYILQSKAIRLQIRNHWKNIHLHMNKWENKLRIPKY